MPRDVRREPQLLTKDEFLAADAGLPGRAEFVRGVVGPYTDAGKVALLANWGVDDILRLTGPEVWLEAIAAREARDNK